MKRSDRAFFTVSVPNTTRITILPGELVSECTHDRTRSTLLFSRLTAILVMSITLRAAISMVSNSRRMIQGEAQLFPCVMENFS